jgi:hypothetical protein
METRRIFQTTLVHALRPEFSVAALFLDAAFTPGMLAEGGAEGGTQAVCRSLGIEPLSGGEISAEELRRVVVCLLTGSLEVFDMNPRAFQFYVNQSGIEEAFLNHVLSEARLVVARPHPTSGGALAAQTLNAQTLNGLLAGSLAAGLGFYALGERDRLHDVSGRHMIELLFLILPEGLLLAGSQRGLDRALHFGLYERLHQAFIAPRIR